MTTDRHDSERSSETNILLNPSLSAEAGQEALSDNAAETECPFPLQYPVMFGGAPFDEAKKQRLDDALQFFNTFLEGKEWAAGPKVTIADHSLAASVSTMDAVGYSLDKYPNVQKWYAKVQKELPGYSVNAEGAEAFKQLYLHLTGKKWTIWDGATLSIALSLTEDEQSTLSDCKR